MGQHDLTEKERLKRLEDAAAGLIRRKDMNRPQDADETAVAETWDALALLAEDKAILAELRTPYRAAWWQRTDVVRMAAGGLVAAVLVAGIGVTVLTASQDYRTKIGEQRLIALSDGSQVTLNTDSEIAVRIDGRERRVELKRGEAYFDVAKLNGAPFVVKSGASEIRVTGTKFNVGHSDDFDRVDLVEGRVLAGAHAASRPEGAAVLTAGQAVVLDKAGLVRWRGAAEVLRVDNWRRGRVYFRETPLRDAVADMNRYTRTRMVITSPGIADMPVSGVFRAGSSESFARALSLAYPVRVQVRDNVIEISQNNHNNL